VASYLGLTPSERSERQKLLLGAISKQGNVFLRTMLVDAAQSAVRHDEEFRKEYEHRCHAKPKCVAKMAAARKLAVRLYWMRRTQKKYAKAIGNKAVHNWGQPESSCGRLSPDRLIEWAPLHPAEAGCSQRESCQKFWPHQWLVEPERSTENDPQRTRVRLVLQKTGSLDLLVAEVRRSLLSTRAFGLSKD
jgi:hypothetical protein